MLPSSITKTQNRRTRVCKRNRRGTEVVELAIILPLLMLLTFATLETCENIFLIQKVKIAAHEGAVVAITKTGTLADVQDAVQGYLDARDIDYGDDISTAVTVSPDPTTAATLEPITVTVTVPTDENSHVGAHLYRFFGGTNAVGDVTMLKEFKR